jgi:outer membrane protein
MTSLRSFRAARTLSALGLTTVTTFVGAQDAAPASSPDPNALQAVVGVAAVSAPRYAGSKRDRIQVLPVVSIAKGPWFIDTLRGVGAQYQTQGGFSVSEALHYDFGRRDRDDGLRPGADELRGMGDVPGSVVSRTIVAQQFSPVLSTSAEAEYSLRDGTHRARFRAGLQWALIQRDSDMLTWNADIHAGNASFNQAYFGVSPLQATRTRFTPYRAAGGVYAYSSTLTWTHVFSPHWSTSVTLSGLRYTGKASGSPIVARRTALTSAVAMNYAL